MIKNATSNIQRKSRPSVTRSQMKRQRGQIEAYRRKQEDQRETPGNKEDTMAKEMEYASMTTRKHHLCHDKWHKVDSRVVKTGTRLDGGNGNKTWKGNKKIPDR